MPDKATQRAVRSLRGPRNKSLAVHGSHPHVVRHRLDWPNTKFRGTKMRRGLRGFSLVGVFLLVGCYHAQIETGRPAGSTVITKPWAMSFAWGLIPPPVENVSQQCTSGVSKVETQHSFMNGLVAIVTFGIVTPIQIDVTCAGAGGDNDNSLATVRVDGDPRAALVKAIELSIATGRAVYAQF